MGHQETAAEALASGASGAHAMVDGSHLLNSESGVRAIDSFDVSDLPAKIAARVPTGSESVQWGRRDRPRRETGLHELSTREGKGAPKGSVLCPPVRSRKK